MKFAIVCVTYNRKDSLHRLLQSLDAVYYDEDVTLIISIDKSDTDIVEKFADSYVWTHGEKRIAKHEKNLGLRAHILSLGRYFDEFDALVVLEDDITVATSFYIYAKQCVEKYASDHRIAGISLYNFAVNYQNFLPFTPAKSQYDVYLMNCAMSWGQVWMKQQWEAFYNWYTAQTDDCSAAHLPHVLSQWSKSSWLKYHTRYCIEEDKFFVYPYFSLATTNTDIGEHSNQMDTLYQSTLQVTLQTNYLLPTFEEAEIRYDGFFQPRFLASHLGLSEEDLCVDVFSEKPSSLYRRYVLSNRLLPYAVKQSFALQLRPFEMNIIYHLPGNELWLYDTSVSAQPPKGSDRYLAFYYLFYKAFYKIHVIIGFKRSMSLLTEVFVNKIKKVFA